MKTTFTTAVQVQTEKFTVLAGSRLTRLTPTLKLSTGLVSSAVGIEIKTEDIPHVIELLQQAMSGLRSAESKLQ